MPVLRLRTGSLREVVQLLMMVWMLPHGCVQLQPADYLISDIPLQGSHPAHELVHEGVEVGGVVEHLLRALADGSDRLHGVDGVGASQGLRAQHDGIHAVQHRIGHICGLSPAREEQGRVWQLWKPAW